jgi:hypothetical protein
VHSRSTSPDPRLHPEHPSPEEGGGRAPSARERVDGACTAKFAGSRPCSQRHADTEGWAGERGGLNDGAESGGRKVEEGGERGLMEKGGGSEERRARGGNHFRGYRYWPDASLL